MDGKLLYGAAVKCLSGILLLSVLLFVPAGTLRYPNAWLLSAAVLLIVICSVSLFFVSKSRNFQFFGELIASVPNGNKKIALTFDDGPTENTGLILNKPDERL